MPLNVVFLRPQDWSRLSPITVLPKHYYRRQGSPEVQKEGVLGKKIAWGEGVVDREKKGKKDTRPKVGRQGHEKMPCRGFK